MMDDVKPFRYFRNPRHPLSSWSGEGGICHFCGRIGPGFGGPYYGRHEVDFVCEACLRQGRLADLSLRTCEADLRTLRVQLAAFHGDLVSDELEALATERTDELETRTPALQTWQDFSWPAHCGDYCEFVEELGMPEIVELAASEEPKAWFVANTRHGEGAWGCIRRDSSRRYPEKNYDTTVYRFSCRVCAQDILHWDAS